MRTKKGNWLLFDEPLKSAVYVADYEAFYWNEYGWKRYKEKTPRILKVIKNGQREWDWAMKTWGVEPQEMEEMEKSILLHANAGVKTLAIKNSKGESWIFQQSPFFKTSTGYLVCRVRGNTMGTLGLKRWDLYNVEQYREVSESTSETPYAVFGTWLGEEEIHNNIREGDIIPITQSEWERLSGRKFFLQSEFSWFRGGIKMASCWGITRTEKYIFRHTFEEHRKNGRYGVYRDGSFDMLPTQRIDSPFGEIYMAEDGGIRIFFGRFKFFNLRTVWVEYESVGEPLDEVFSQLKRKVVGRSQCDLNSKLRRSPADELTPEQVEKILFSTSIDSLVGNLITKKELKYLKKKRKIKKQKGEIIVVNNKKITIRTKSRVGNYRDVWKIMFIMGDESISYDDIDIRTYKKRLKKVKAHIEEKRPNLNGFTLLKALGELFYLTDDFWDSILEEIESR